MGASSAGKSRRRFCPGKVTLWDSCFELPGQNLQSQQSLASSIQSGTISHKLAIAGSDQLELYDYPGGYAQRFDGVAPGGGDRSGDLNKVFQDGTRTAGLRMQERAAGAIVIEGQSLCPQLTARAQVHASKITSTGMATTSLVEVEHNASVEGRVYGRRPERPRLAPEELKQQSATIESAQRWADEHRRAAGTLAEAANYETPAALTAQACFWSEGSMAPAGGADVPAPPHLGPRRTLEQPLRLAAVCRDPENAAAKHQRFLDIALSIRQAPTCS